MSRTLLSPTQKYKPENVVFPALPPLPPGCAKVCWFGHYLWDDEPHPEAWTKDGLGRLWVTKWLNNDWTAWELNHPAA